MSAVVLARRGRYLLAVDPASDPADPASVALVWDERDGRWLGGTRSVAAVLARGYWQPAHPDDQVPDAAFQLKAKSPTQFAEWRVLRDRIGRFTDKPGADAGRRYRLTELDAGFEHDPADDKRPAVRKARRLRRPDWDGLPARDVPLDQLHVLEADVSAAPVDRVVEGRQAMREDYQAHVVIDPDGTAILVDGHHRAAMHAQLGDAHLPARVLDLRDWKPITELDEATVTAETAHLRELAATAEPDVTADLEALVDWLGDGARLDKLDKRLKTEASIRDRARRNAEFAVAKGKDVDSAWAVRGVPDALRYTVVVPTEAYTDAVADLMDELERLGYRGHHGGWANSWHGSSYRGMNLRLVPPSGDVVMELQLHTPESAAAKDRTHKLYEAARKLAHADPERRRLFDDMRKITLQTPVPKGAGALDWPGDYTELYDWRIVG